MMLIKKSYQCVASARCTYCSAEPEIESAAGSACSAAPGRNTSITTSPAISAMVVTTSK
jgi:hypothetical protein